MLNALIAQKFIFSLRNCIFISIFFFVNTAKMIILHFLNKLHVTRNPKDKNKIDTNYEIPQYILATEHQKKKWQQLLLFL